MFADSLIDTTWTDRSRRGWTTLVSFAMQAAGLGGLLLLPLLYTQGLPQLQLMSSLVAPAPPPAPPAPAPARNTAVSSNLSPDGHVIAPPSVPRQILNIDEPVAPPPVNLNGLGVSGGTADPAGPPIRRPATAFLTRLEMDLGLLCHRLHRRHPLNRHAFPA